MFYSIKELAAKMNRSENEINKIINDGYFPNSKINRKGNVLISNIDIKLYETNTIKEFDYWSVPEIAQHLHLSREKVRQMIKKRFLVNLELSLH